ncbi:MAG: rhomboid family intramembrane serine protease [Candidatus Anammoxibacter sp.]
MNFNDIGLDGELITNCYYIIIFIGLIWLIEIINFISGHSLNRFGIFPRRFSGVIGIFLAPFLHNGICHVSLNTIPFVTLGGLVILVSKELFIEITIFIIVISGAATWMFGRGVRHVGASSLIFGYFGFLITNGLNSGDIKSITIAVITVLFYGSLLWLARPTRKAVSWEGHLFGLAAGICKVFIGREVLGNLSL